MARRSKRKKPAVFKALKKIKKALRIRRTRARRPARSVMVSPRIALASDASLPESSPTFRPRAFEADARIPPGYGEDKLALLVRDPWWVFAYWEVTPACADRVLAAMPVGLRDARVTVLRMYDLTEGSFDRPNSFFDIELRVAADRWYVDTGSPDRAWGAEIGFRLPDGRFWPLVRSNVVRTPRFGFSSVLDEEWMIPDEDFWKLVGAYGPDEFVGSSGRLQKRPGEFFWRTTSSDGSSQFSLKAGPAQGAR